jgi:hypothetical protein
METDEYVPSRPLGSIVRRSVLVTRNVNRILECGQFNIGLLRRWLNSLNVGQWLRLGRPPRLPFWSGWVWQRINSRTANSSLLNGWLLLGLFLFLFL